MNISHVSIWKRAVAALLATTALSTGANAAGNHDATTQTPIKHIVIIFGENISFDHYFARSAATALFQMLTWLMFTMDLPLWRFASVVNCRDRDRPAAADSPSSKPRNALGGVPERPQARSSSDCLLRF